MFGLWEALETLEAAREALLAAEPDALLDDSLSALNPEI